ncbi:MAG: hypothetical protein ACFBZ8_07460 [Opitutales bacterium]
MHVSTIESSRNQPTGQALDALSWQRSFRLDAAYKPQVEALFFFNPRQTAFLPWIEAAIERFGIPKLEVNAQRQLHFTLGDEPVDALYLIDRELFVEDLPRVVAVALHRRVAPDRLAVIHLALDPEAPGASTGQLMDALLLQMRTLAQKARGVKWLWLLYAPGEGVFFRVLEPDPA